jgi:thiol-disulfide isomerase/thioredoxin
MKTVTIHRITHTLTRHITAIALAAFILVTGGCGQDQEAHARGSESSKFVRINSPAPNFTLPYHGKTGSLSLEDLRGDVVLVNFWASWCPPCKAELPDLVELSEEYTDEGLTILGVIVNSPPDEINQVTEQFGIPYTSVVGTSAMSNYWQVESVPTTYILDKAGKVRYKYVGSRNRVTFERDILRLLNEG